MVDRAALHLRHAIICDGMRTEQDGKLTFIGAVHDQVVHNVRPAFAKVSLSAVFDLPEVRVGKYELEVVGPSGRQVAKIDLADAPAGVTTVGFALDLVYLLESEDSIVFRHRKVGEKWSRGVSWLLKFDDDTTVLPDDKAESIRRAFSLFKGADAALGAII